MVYSIVSKLRTGGWRREGKLEKAWKTHKLKQDLIIQLQQDPDSAGARDMIKRRFPESELECTCGLDSSHPDQNHCNLVVWFWSTEGLAKLTKKERQAAVCYPTLEHIVPSSR